MATMTFDKLLGKYTTDAQTLAAAARKFILDTLPKADESLDESAGVVGYGYGSGYKGIICTLILSKSGVKLGLAHGAALPDPDGLLEGCGKVHRFIQLREPSDIRRPGVARLLKAARAAWQERVG
jgi:hypothetical protein